MVNVTKDGDIDIMGIIRFLQSFTGTGTFCCIEDVHSVHCSSAKSNFQFGLSLGIVQALAIDYVSHYEKVSPLVWQTAMFEGIELIEKFDKKKKKYKRDTKAMAAEAFKKIFPDYIDRFMTTVKGNKSKNLHDGLVDAALIAEYYRRELNRGVGK